jgi:hypothetical protein
MNSSLCVSRELSGSTAALSLTAAASRLAVWRAVLSSPWLCTLQGVHRTTQRLLLLAGRLMSRFLSPLGSSNVQLTRPDEFHQRHGLTNILNTAITFSQMFIIINLFLILYNCYGMNIGLDFTCENWPPCDAPGKKADLSPW